MRVTCVGIFDIIIIEFGDYCVIKCFGYDVVVGMMCFGFGICGFNDVNVLICMCNEGYSVFTTGCAFFGVR